MYLFKVFQHFEKKEKVNPIPDTLSQDLRHIKPLFLPFKKTKALIKPRIKLIFTKQTTYFNIPTSFSALMLPYTYLRHNYWAYLCVHSNDIIKLERAEFIFRKYIPIFKINFLLDALDLISIFTQKVAPHLFKYLLVKSLLLRLIQHLADL